MWLSYWRVWRRYHRYTVHGFEEHVPNDEARLIVGYHARGLAVDMCILTLEIYERLGYLPHGMVHRGVEKIPPLRWLTKQLGFVVRDNGDDLRAAVDRHQHLVATPGGGEEGCRRFDDSYRVNWGENLGYVRIAVKYGLKIVPVGAAGVDACYIGLTSGPDLGRRLGFPKDYEWLAWVGLGPLGVWPFSPPFPVRLYQLIGPPIDPRDHGATSPADDRALRDVHRRVMGAVQGLIDEARARVRDESEASA
jgi:hypothetical protein